MVIEADNLPQDTEALKGIIRELLGSLKSKDVRIRQLLDQLAKLQRWQFGKKSEKIDPNQLLLAFNELKDLKTLAEEAAKAQAAAEAKTESLPTKRRKGHGRKKLPESLRRERIEIDVLPEEKHCSCCDIDKTRIGEEVTEELEYQPSSLFIREIVRPKYACCKCEEGVSIAPAPARVVDKGKFGPGFLSFAITSKYTDHIPLNRMVEMLKRQGVELGVSTICDSVGRCADLLEPVWGAMCKDVLASEAIQTDDTIIPVLDGDRDRTRKGRIWTYLGDAAHPSTVFDFTAGRGAEGPRTFLKGYGGYLQADAYKGYDGLFNAASGPSEVGCWAHARRYFFDARESDPLPANTALAFIRLLYDVEAEAKCFTADERQVWRHDRAGPILDKFHFWLSSQSSLALPKSPIADAIRYALSNWAALKKYLENGRLQIDNNNSERVLRSVVVGRKNWLFAGSDEGGRRAAIIYSLVATCKRHGVDPFVYFRDVLVRVSTHPASDIKALFPQNWKAPSAGSPA